jgi:membrane protease YdiL (CAAX protease family)
VAVIIASVIFSAVHFSYLGFLTRFLLGFVLGWIYYRTGNLWLCIIGHFFNNAFSVTAIYLSSKPGEQLTTAKMDDNLPLWTGVVSLVALVALFKVFEKVSEKNMDRPGEEVLIPGYGNSPFDNDIAFNHNTNQQ